MGVRRDGSRRAGASGYGRGGRWVAFALATGCAAVAAGRLTAQAQASDRSGQERPVTAVELAELPRADVPGRLAVYRGTTGPAGDLLRLEGLDMQTSVGVIVRAEDAARRVAVALHKDGHREALRRAETGTAGTATLEFRTYGEVVIELSAAAPARYTLLIWAGPPTEIDVPSPFVAPEASARIGRWLVPAVTAASGLGVVVAVFWIARRSRRRWAGTALGLALLVAAGPRSAGAGSGWSAGFEPPKLSKPEELTKEVDGLASTLQKGLEVWKNREAFEPLDSADLDYEPELAPPGAPRVPLRCSLISRCGPCLRKAHANLDDVRRKLENNRIVLAHYKRYMQKIFDAAKALGGLHGMLGVAAIKEQTEWNELIRETESRYDTRYMILMIELEEALRQVESCEAVYLNDPGWYDRFGFVYYEFMAARYRRTD